MPTRNHLPATKPALLALAIALPAASLAAPDAQLEEMVVTAQKREQNIMEVPQSMQAFSGAEIERIGIRDFEQLTRDIPGASVVSKSAAGFETIQLRGISSGTVGDATVGYYIDELAFGIPNLQLAPPARMIDLERVEVLRGPQGTLYGQGSMGGTIKLITADPDTTAFSAKAAVEGSQTEDGGDNYAVDAAVNIPVVKDRFALRLSGSTEDLSGWAKSADTGDDDINEVESDNWRIKGLLTPTENLEIAFSYWSVENDQDYSNFFTTVEPPLIFTGRTEDSWVKSNADMYTALIRYEMPFATLESGTAYTEHELAFDLGFGVPIVPGFNVALVNDSAFETDSLTQELRLVSNADGPFHWIVGGFYTDATIDSSIDLYFTPDLGGLLPALILDDGEVETESWSAFGEASVDLMDGFMTALVGLRYFEDDRSAEGTSLIYGPSAAGDTFTSTNPRFNLSIHPWENGMVFANVAKGFRSGGIQTAGQALLGNLAGVQTSQIIEEDSLWTYELGTKWSLADGSFLVDAAVYYTDWSDMQVPFDALGTGLVSIVNAGDAEVSGIDLGLSWSTPIDGLVLQLSANVNDTEFKDIDAALSLVLPTVSDGEPLPGVPEKSYAISATYSWALGVAGLDGFAYASYSYRDKQIDLASGLVSDDIEDIAARIGVQDESWELYLFGANLGDERGPGTLGVTTQNGHYPRRVGVQLKYHYN